MASWTLARWLRIGSRCSSVLLLLLFSADLAQAQWPWSPPGYSIIEDEASPLDRRHRVNFTGAGVTCTTAATKTVCTIAGGAGHSHVYHEEIAGSGTGPFTLAATPNVGSDIVHINTVRQRRLGSCGGINEYTISGDTITLCWSKAAGDYFTAEYEVP
jgi:hypothetical protein